MNVFAKNCPNLPNPMIPIFNGCCVGLLPLDGLRSGVEGYSVVIGMFSNALRLALIGPINSLPLG